MTAITESRRDTDEFIKVANYLAAAEKRFHAARARLVVLRRMGGDSVRKIAVDTGLRVAIVEAVLQNYGQLTDDSFYLRHGAVDALDLSTEVLRGVGGHRGRFYWTAAHPDHCACQTRFDAPAMRPVCLCQCE
jgi:hypothetical protein